jgi:hypothetical protein
MALGPPWDYHVSPSCQCRFDSERRVLYFEGRANCHAFVERPLNPGNLYDLSAEVLCGFDASNAWGAGIALCWPDQRFVRVNVRADGRYGVDDGRRTTLAGTTPTQGWTTLRLRLTPVDVLAEASAECGLWAVLASFPREAFPGSPCAMRLGKMSRWGTAKDFHNPGPVGHSVMRKMLLLVLAA